MSRSATRSVAACASSSDAGQLCSLMGSVGLEQIAAHRQFHLQRVYAIFGLAVVARDPSAAEAAIGHARERRRVADPLHRRGERAVAARAVVRADVELRQLAVEQPRHARADRMRVVQHHLPVFRAQALEFARERGVVGIEVFSARGARSRRRPAPRRACRGARRRTFRAGTARWSPGLDTATHRTDRDSRRSRCATSTCARWWRPSRARSRTARRPSDRHPCAQATAR